MARPVGHTNAEPTPLHTILYVSTSIIPAAAVDATVAHIVADATRLNRELEITGALLFTGSRFAQIIEGSRAALDDLMGRLEVNRHHRDLIVLEDRTIAERRFSAWQMAYAGPSAYVGRAVDRVFTGAGAPTPGAIRALVKLMTEFATAH